ncbi:oligoribonuclease NrnB [Campylobacter blaseri]|uniref:3'-to-5' oligoribonuclease B n=1 Tax=Campylobacter blaseri TaxID=2042961 RepID=A0A2P8R230_9BACT|nr:3'-to-5' oligoribonuclease B [Campylobacter blaseri]PSM52555.1 3'-to-5' oligoribonuclease B [Campylobacter blaseri]PSM54203.1 3'-to-5' oligoribonuclease B [Campylobacter blaseri]QKF85854.1 oligoribonuclease NrnB [Campylobacter blaseri]
MKIYHLSHTDLDGYGAQFVTKFYFSDIKFYNSNYGKEIDVKFDQILNEMDDEKSIVLITDLNLTLTQCAKFEEALKDKNSKIMLLDHHQTGLECAKKYPWYLLDNERCATKITYDFFSSIYGKDEKLDKFVRVVNSVDIWLKDEPEFELGKVCLGLVSMAKEINNIMFGDTSRDYIFYLLDKTQKYFNEKDGHIALDEALHIFKKSYFIKEKNDTLNNLISTFVVDMLSQNKEKFMIQYRDKTGILTYNIGNTSIIGNEFLVRNPDIDFFLDMTSRKTMSFRANNSADVSLIAKELVGGGGHVNASGGFYPAFKDGHTYEIIKKQIVDLIEKKTKAEEASKEQMAQE